MLVKNAFTAKLMVLVAVVVNATAAIEDIRVHDKQINQKVICKVC